MELLKRRTASALGMKVQAKPYFIFYLLQGILSVSSGLSAVIKSASLDTMPNDLIEVLLRSSDYGATFVPTWEPLGLPAINLMYAHAIYPVGLVDSDVMVDGLPHNPVEFTLHDLDHIQPYENLIHPQQKIGRESPLTFSIPFYHQFNYRNNLARTSPNERLLYDFAHFLYFHESLGNLEFAYGPFKNINVATLQDYYRSSFLNHDNFKFEFGINGQVKVLYRKKPGSFFPGLVDRLLERSDMRSQLPLEIEAQIKASPDKAQEIIGHFAEKFLTLFFQIHYDVAKKTLGLSDSQNSP